MLTLYFLSNSYIGLDQQYDICLDVIEASLETQLNTEIVTEEGQPAPRLGIHVKAFFCGIPLFLASYHFAMPCPADASIFLSFASI